MKIQDSPLHEDSMCQRDERCGDIDAGGDGIITETPGRTQTKSRRHEKVLNEYAQWIRTRGFAPSNQEHPIDLILRKDQSKWLVEVKVVYHGNATRAVREAIAQLLDYPAEARGERPVHRSPQDCRELIPAERLYLLPLWKGFDGTQCQVWQALLLHMLTGCQAGEGRL